MTKKRLGLSMLAALGLSLTVASTALAKGEGPGKHEHGQRDDDKRDHGDRDRGEKPRGAWDDKDGKDHKRGPRDFKDHRDDRLAEKAERMRRYEQKAREQREQERRDAEGWRKSREERARNHRKEIQETWGSAWRTDRGREELAKHADRMARLHRAQDVAKDMKDAELIAKIARLIDVEVARSIGTLTQIAMTAQ